MVRGLFSKKIIKYNMPLLYWRGCGCVKEMESYLPIKIGARNRAPTNGMHYDALEFFSKFLSVNVCSADWAAVVTIGKAPVVGAAFAHIVTTGGQE